MGKFWLNEVVFSDLQEAIPEDEVQANIAFPFADPAVLIRTLVWWDARWFTPLIVNGGNKTPLNWDFEIIAVEGATGEPPPPGPVDPIMQGLITATGPGTTFPGADESADIFQAWLGSSGALPMDSKAKRAAVNYSDGMQLQLRFRNIMTIFNPEGWWWGGPWSLMLKIALLIDNPSF